MIDQPFSKTCQVFTLVIDRGKIVERGTHEELIARMAQAIGQNAAYRLTWCVLIREDNEKKAFQINYDLECFFEVYVNLGVSMESRGMRVNYDPM